VRIALVHDWLTERGDREKVLLSLVELFKGADIFTMIYNPDQVDPIFRTKHVKVSALQSIPFGKKSYFNFLPLYWELTGRLDLSEYDLVISSSVVCAKWVRTSKTAMHVCYCHTPFRAIWGLSDSTYDFSLFSPSNRLGGLFSNYLKWCDLKSNQGVTHFMASSTEVQTLIKELYGRESELFFPPVENERFEQEKQKGEHFILVSGQKPSVRVKRAINLFSELKKPMRVFVRGKVDGEWQGFRGEMIQVESWVESETPRVFSEAKGLICIEGDISPILAAEALAAGCPLLVGEDVRLSDVFTEGETGLNLSLESAGKLSDGLEQFEKTVFDVSVLRQKVSRFSKARFLFKTQVYFRRLFGITTIPENEKL
jgi:glycosyltransferase involved in cell wall biosynthesis